MDGKSEKEIREQAPPSLSTNTAYYLPEGLFTGNLLLSPRPVPVFFSLVPSPEVSSLVCLQHPASLPTPLNFQGYEGMCIHFARKGSLRKWNPMRLHILFVCSNMFVILLCRFSSVVSGALFVVVEP
eukprot:Hpha_TRINITY_DN12315_c0_g1::TRINITY_DN12315_c0_g1_i1::g.156120::m.156120